MQGNARKKLLIWHFLEGTLSNLGNSVRCLLLIMPAHKFLHLVSVHLKCTLMHEGMGKLNNQETRKPKLCVFHSLDYLQPLFAHVIHPRSFSSVFFTMLSMQFNIKDKSFVFQGPFWKNTVIPSYVEILSLKAPISNEN